MHQIALLVLLAAAGPLAAAPLDDARAALEARDTAGAIAILEPLANGAPADGAVLHELGRAYLRADRLDDAIAVLERSLAARPNAAETHHLYGAAVGRKLQSSGMFAAIRNAPKVKASFERAVALAPDAVEYREALIQYYLAAPSIAGGSKDKAREQAGEIAKRDARRGTLMHARVQLADDDRDGALATLRGAIERWPDDGGLRLQLGLFHQDQKQWAEAFAALDEATRRDPGAMSAWYQIGRTAVLSGQRLADGEAAFKRYLAGEPGPDDPPRAAAHWRLGMLYELMKQPAGARSQYQAALKLDPEHKEAKAALKKLKAE